MNKIKKMLSVFLSIPMIFGCFAIDSSAAAVVVGNITSGNAEYEDSIGSMISDYTGNDNPVGYDKTQGIESAYKHALIDNSDTYFGNITEEVNVYGTVAPFYSIKIPKVIILSSAGLGHYDIGVKGDMSGAQTLTIVPTDKIETTPEIDFYMAEQGASIGAKDDIVAIINQDKIEWKYSDINKDDYTWLPSAGEIEARSITAGSWAGTFDFNINVEILKTSGSEYFALYAPGVETIEQYGVNYGDFVKEIANEYSISYYTTCSMLLTGFESDSNAMIAAQESDEAYDSYVNATYLEMIKESTGLTEASSIEDLLSLIIGFNAKDLANFIETGELPEGYDPLKNYDGPIYLTFAYKYNIINDNRSTLPSDLVLPTELFGYKIDGLAVNAFSGYDEIEYIYIPSTYTLFKTSQFNNCTAKEIVICSQSFELTDEYFAGNEHLEAITLPDNTTEIPEGAFAGCINLKEINY